MKVTVNIAKVLVGLLFIFSGLVKAIDPLGLSYKMQEFFEAWQSGGFMPGLMSSLHGYSLPFSLIMITLEVAAGVALLVGFRIRFTAWLLLLLMLFFTFLTSYVLFSGKIAACGCFGDCIPLTPNQTFTKDIILTLLVILILTGRKYIRPLLPGIMNFIVVLISIIAVLFLQWYVMKHLPLADCLPYKKGNNILELRKIPKDAVADKIEMTFIYEKNGEKKDFDVKHLPDSSWKYVDRKEKIIEAGKNNKPLINDFTMNTSNGNDSTEAILSQPGEYYLAFVKLLPVGNNISWANKLYTEKQTRSIPSYIITSIPEQLKNALKGHEWPQDWITVFTCDATAIKTAARTDVTIYLMKGPVVEQKWSGADF
ncbi:MAG: BT_3928 family protein [Ferruginibacter sp.]